MLKPETIALCGARLSFAEKAFNTPAGRRWITGQDGSGGAIPKQTSTDENAPIVIQIKRCAAHLHANRKHSATLARIEQRGRSAQAGKGGPASLPDQVQQTGIT